jgi:hypothetical protein
MLSIRDRIFTRLTILWEKLHRQDFSIIIPPSELGMDGDLVVHGSSSCDKYLIAVLKNINISSRDSILDIGCAKGGAIKCMSRFPFSKIHGLELSSTLAKIATSNFLKRDEARVCIENINAIDFEGYSEFNIFYFYHPFPEQVMTKVLNNMKMQLDLEKEVLIIYNHPVCHDQVINSGFYKIKEFPDAWGNGIFLYSSLKPTKRLSVVS